MYKNILNGPRYPYVSGFGISSQFWDHIFGTAIALKKLSRCLKWY